MCQWNNKKHLLGLIKERLTIDLTGWHTSPKGGEIDRKKQRSGNRTEP
jgi:hypothetical protein